MLRYIALINWTEQGAKNAPDTVQRSQQAQQMIEQLGGRMETIYWTQGRYDLVAILEAPDEETATAMLLRVGGMGSVRTETLRAFDAEEMGRIIGKLG
jgi:uncharacterized protein with GYD domain